MPWAVDESVPCFQVLLDDVNGHQVDIDEMIDHAQAVAHVAGDTRVSSQASQLASHYQSLAVKLKVSGTCRGVRGFCDRRCWREVVQDRFVIRVSVGHKNLQ